MRKPDEERLACSSAARQVSGYNPVRLMSLATGARLGPYEIVSPLGAGGMGEVYRARDTRLNRSVAVKVLPTGAHTDPARLARFEQEARTASQLNHPNIVALYDVGAHGDQPFIVTELLDGATLHERMADGALPRRKAIDYALQIARGLAAAHEHGIVHRDLKPQNVFVTNDGQVKLLDFGLAKLLRPDSAVAPVTSLGTTPPLTDAGMVLGTVGYMSPEQVRGDRVDHRSDLFSCGVILYEMLTGRRAFNRGSTVETMHAILTAEPVLLADDRVPADLERILRHCLEKSAGARFQSARDLGFALEATVASPSGATAAVSAHRAWMVPLVGALAAALGIAIGWFVRSAAPVTSAPSFSRVVRLTASAAHEFGPAIAPDAKWVAYLSDARGTTDLWVKFIGGGDAVNLTAGAHLNLATRTDISGVDISPDGTQIAFAASSEGQDAPKTWIIPAPLGGVAHPFLEGRGVRWSPDGRRIAYIRAGGSAGDTLFVADADGSNARETVPARGGMHVHWPAWSADGRDVYYIYTIATWNGEPAEIYRVSASGGTPERVVASASRAVFPNPTPDGKGLIYAANPARADLNLWWRPLSGGAPVRLTSGVGEFGEPRISSDGRAMVCTLFDVRQSLIRMPVGADPSARPTSLSDGYTADLDPNVARNGDRLVFSSSRSGDRNVWIANLDLTGAQPVTSGPATDDHPVFSPDGQQIAFISNRGGERGLWTIGREGGVPKRVVTAVVLEYFSWSPDGREIVYASPAGNLPGLSIVTVADGRVRRLPTLGGASSPAWSPIGDAIAYLEPPGSGPANPHLRFVNGRGEAIGAALADDPFFLNGFLSWSPDGQRLAAVRSPGGAGLSSVWVVEPGAARPFRRLLEVPVGVRLRGITWSADGQSVLYGQDQSSSHIVLFDQAR
jgi:Tol biopolymer transport system component